MRSILKGLIVWLLAALPVGAVAGVLVSTFVPQDAVIDRSTAAFNGLVAGLELGAIGGIAAMATTTLARGTLRRAGGSECLTGAIVAYGFIGAGIVLLLFAT